MNGEKDIELIDRYLNNELSLNERNDFNTRLTEDPTFNELFQFVNNLRVVTKVKGRAEIGESVNELFKESLAKKNPIINITSIKSYFENFRLQPLYAIAASVLILIISSIIIVVFIRKPSSTENIAINKSEKNLIDKLNADSLIYHSKSLLSNKFVPENIISKEFGFVSNESTKPSSLNIKIINDKKYAGNYILFSDTVILLGNLEINNLKNVFNFPRFYIMNYSEKYYRLQKIERKIMPFWEETDSAIIKATLKPQ